MNLHELVSQLIVDTKGPVDGSLFSLPSADSSLGVFLPEICLCVTIVLMLLVRVFRFGRRVDAFYFAAAGSLVALCFVAPWQHLGVPTAAVARMEIFTGMLVYDPFSIFIRSLLLGFTFLFTIFTKLSGIPDREDGPDIYTMVLGATLGMCLMASANHLLMVFMAIEMASVPSYVLAGMMKGRRVGSEAALKYSIYGAGAAGVMLYGISLVSGLLNTAHLPTIALTLSERLPTMQPGEMMVLVLAALMIMVGLAFKLSAVPFHFWCPDVFEGATAEVNAFLSVASKAAALALLVRVAIGFGGISPDGVSPGFRSDDQLAAKQATTNDVLGGITSADGLSNGLFSIADEEAAPAHPSHSDQPTPSGIGATKHVTNDQQPAAISISAIDGLERSQDFLAKMIAWLAIVSCTFGNLAAYGQTNIKRLLAYSTIAHAGFMMMPVAAMLVLVKYDPRSAESAIAAISIYLTVYLFMNLGAFAIIAFLRNAMQTETIADYAGLIRRCPITVICFVLILFSLIGLPPLAGFIGKFAIFASLADGYRLSAAAGEPATFLVVLLVVGGLNTAISLFYYLRVAKVMTMDPEPEDRRPFVFSDVSLQGFYIWILTLPTALLMLNWDVLNRWAQAAAKYLLA
ncbi:MAG TPA: NADH-quinone oxidoreductase subunit N [Pirellulaceae bacterium]|nr:NADH-quinone oxidoreductase subunit N [Pirellulaceae bacterium]